MKFGKDEKELILLAISSFIKFLDRADFDDKKYIDEVRALHLKILRNTDWSYIFWNMPRKEFSGKIKVRLSSFSDIRRKSIWKLYSDGRLKLSSFIFSKQIYLADRVQKIKQKSNECFTLSFKDFEEIDISADPGAAQILSCISELIHSESFVSRTIPALIIIDSIAHTLSLSQLRCKEKQKLKDIQKAVSSAFYGVNPKFISLKSVSEPSAHSNSSDKIKIEIGEESLLFLYSILNEYCEIKENSPNYDNEKLSAAKKLRDIFRKANEN